MLVLSLDRNEGIQIRADALVHGVVRVVALKGESCGRMRLGFDAPKEIRIIREEVLRRDNAAVRHGIDVETLVAARIDEALEELMMAMDKQADAYFNSPTSYKHLAGFNEAVAFVRNFKAQQRAESATVTKGS